VTVSGGSASVDNTRTTGVTDSISGATGVSNATVTTQSLNSPSTGVSAFSTSGTLTYFEIKVTLPAGTIAPSGATVQVCFTSPSVSSTDILYYSGGSSWVEATGSTVTGFKI